MNTKTKIEYTVKKVKSEYYTDEKHIGDNYDGWSVNKFIHLDDQFEKVKNKMCYVKNGCDPRYGFCYDNIISTNGKCGPKYGKCPSGQCCNKNGKCGTKATFCSKQNGCQSKYGKCKNIVIVTKKKVVTKVITKKKN
ncbi:hypothetical protein BCR32DRAFT_72541 [Anaeromyces robustus]|uniref:Chitin-binding type-1 domain-containing protein n=1 Tax=Anaeromyces robustus TaxID=1754192 RepID=A0A1Y1WT01_9FUNG|nr:hypothetical protein BCR32DRAFT_72541 [Anaeromyces robustus]|eukprot:ORX76669.1 hypothetical protein BCR32DRAFT_72541 [Anaeromyces robustus]